MCRKFSTWSHRSTQWQNVQLRAQPILQDHEIRDIVVTRALRGAAFACLDGVDLIVMFKTRAHVMKSPPKFLKGAHKSAMRVALREWEVGTEVGDEGGRRRAWKLFLLPRMLLHKLVRGGLVPKSKMSERFTSFSQGRWEDLLIQRALWVRFTHI